MKFCSLRKHIFLKAPNKVPPGLQISRSRSEGGTSRSEGGTSRSEGGTSRSEGGTSRSEGGTSRSEGGTSRSDNKQITNSSYYEITKTLEMNHFFLYFTMLYESFTLKLKLLLLFNAT